MRPRNWEWRHWVERTREWEQWVFFFFFFRSGMHFPAEIRSPVCNCRNSKYWLYQVPTYENDFKKYGELMARYIFTHFSRIQDKSYILQLTRWSRPWFKGVSRPCTFRKDFWVQIFSHFLFILFYIPTIKTCHVFT